MAFESRYLRNHFFAGLKSVCTLFVTLGRYLFHVIRRLYAGYFFYQRSLSLVCEEGINY